MDNSYIDDDLAMPCSHINIQELLDNTDPKHIYLTSDWHFFKNHYKHEANYVNTQKILTWCRQNIKPTDVFMYLGDISFRYANDKDTKESQRLMASIPGKKVLVLGNHDTMLGQDYFSGCGFDYVFERIDWQNIVFTHRPINMELMPEDYLNIHGHMHNVREYNTTDGKKNINVYPMWFDNKPVTLDYCLNHIEELIKDNKRSNWTNMGESTVLETNRSNLSNSSFGIPEDRKYPLDTKKHVNSAIKLFGHAKESKKKDLAKRIKSAAKRYDITINKNTEVYKYLNEANINYISIPENIENVIFDMGSVLVNADTLYVLKHSTNDVIVDNAEYIYDCIIKYLFGENRDHKILYGELDEIKEYFKSKLTDNLKSCVDDIFNSFLPAMFQYTYVDDLLEAFRSRGCKLYYLSNWDKYSFELESPFFEALLDKFDGGIFSFEVHCEKPSTSIYQMLTNKYNLDNTKCLFFDDRQENIDAAKLCGWEAILFDYKTTPYEILKSLNTPINLINDSKTLFPVIKDGELSYIDINRIGSWFIAPSKEYTPTINEYYRSLDDAIKDHSCERERDILFYVFTGDTNGNPISLGSIMMDTNNNWEWVIQYPFSIDNNGELIDSIKSNVNEWAMASCNPIVGIKRPFILKTCNDSGSIIDTKHFALSPDIISDKYLIIDENAKLKVINSSELEDCYIEEYEFIGDIRRFKKIEEAYSSGKVVDNTFFYTALTGKPMLSDDQIDFDPLFKKVNFESIAENRLTKIATLNEKINEAMNISNPFKIMINENSNKISLNKDVNGYYIKDELSGARSASTDTINEALSKSIINSLSERGIL